MPDNSQPTPSPGRTLPTTVSGKPLTDLSGKPLTNLSAEEKAKLDQPATLSNVVSSIKKEDFFNIAQMPCARQSFMNGIVGGFAVGGLNVVIRGQFPKAANWAVGSFVLVSAASYEYCLYQRRVEKRNMQLAKKIYMESTRERRKKQFEEQQARKLEEERKAAEARRWYKFW